MISTDNAARLMDSGTVVGSDGDSIGSIGTVYVDDADGRLTWVTVKTGWFGAHESFVPLDDATLDGTTVTVPYDKATVKDAPNHPVDASLSPDEEAELYRYYGVQGDTGQVPAALETTGQAGTDTEVAPTAAASGTPSAEGSITRSEEQLRVGTRSVESGRARLRKYVVTEQRTVSVPVSHEEVTLVREPVAAGEATHAVIGDDTVEVTLMADEVVVDKQAVAVEKIRLGTETVTEQRDVTESVRKEQVELDTDDTVVGSDGTARPGH